jgi:hypothetical protein
MLLYNASNAGAMGLFAKAVVTATDSMTDCIIFNETIMNTSFSVAFMNNEYSQFPPSLSLTVYTVAVGATIA